jgi:hypothetical protein
MVRMKTIIAILSCLLLAMPGCGRRNEPSRPARIHYGKLELDEQGNVQQVTVSGENVEHRMISGAIITIGMSFDEVREKLGRPDHIVDATDSRWSSIASYYFDGDTYYFYFDKDGTGREKLGDIFVTGGY